MTWRRAVIETLLQTKHGPRFLERIVDVQKSLDFSRPDRAEISSGLEEFTKISETNEFSLERFGDRHDGGYLLSPEFLSFSDLVISCGVGANDSFETAVLPFVREIHMVDNTVDYEPTSSKVVFHKKKLVGQILDSSSEISLPELMLDLNHTYIVKLDIEGSEWDILENLGIEYFAAITQMVIEFHGILDFAKSGKLDKVNRIFQRINQYFLVTNFHPNNCGRFEIFLNVPIPDVVEISYLNRKLTNKYSPRTRGKVHDNFPNNPRLPEITLWRP